MVREGEFSYDAVRRWTRKFDILRDYDLMLIPIHIPTTTVTVAHWILAIRIDPAGSVLI